MYTCLFGPVPSRRLGMSLGVDLVPFKTCSFDCVYCESGRTSTLTLDRKEYVPFDAVISEIDHYWNTQPPPDYMTFSGSGEPTLNTVIGKVIRYIKNNRPEIRVAVLTNGSLLWDPQVRQDLLPADMVMPSLDAALPASFRRINRPCPELDLDTYIRGIETFSREFANELFLEIFILPGYNDTREDLEALKQAVNRIRPTRVQLNTLDRPGAVKGLTPASRETLDRIMPLFDGCDTQIISAVAHSAGSPGFRKDIEAAILETIIRRPCTVQDLAAVLGEEVEAVTRHLAKLKIMNKVETVKEQRGEFFQIKMT